MFEKMESGFHSSFLFSVSFLILSITRHITLPMEIPTKNYTNALSYLGERERKIWKDGPSFIFLLPLLSFLCQTITLLIKLSMEISINECLILFGSGKKKRLEKMDPALHSALTTATRLIIPPKTYTNSLSFLSYPHMTTHKTPHVCLILFGCQSPAVFEGAGLSSHPSLTSSIGKVEAVGPGQGWDEGGPCVEEAPAEDDVVVDADHYSSDHHGQADPCSTRGGSK